MLKQSRCTLLQLLFKHVLISVTSTLRIQNSQEETNEQKRKWEKEGKSEDVKHENTKNKKRKE
jgi:hypothetical protein